MRTNIDIDDELMARAMQAGPFKTKREAVEAGLKLLARQAAYKEILKWRGKLQWEGDESVDWTKPSLEEQLDAGSPSNEGGAELAVHEPAPPPYSTAEPAETSPSVADDSTSAVPGSKRRAGR